MKLDWKVILGLSVLGASAGFSYWYFVGCEGGCAITGSPYVSSAYGGIMGALLGGTFKDLQKNKGKED